MAEPISMVDAIASLRADGSPSDADRARVRDALAVGIAGGRWSETAERVNASMNARALGLGRVGNARAPGLARAGAHSLWAKGLASLVVLSGLALGAFFMSQSGAVPRPTEAPARPASAAQAPEVFQLTTKSATATPEIAEPAPAASADAEPAPTALSPAVHRARAKGSVAPAAAAPDQLAAELALIRTASAALRSRDYVAANAALRQHAARFPSGALGRERRGLQALVLCAQAPAASGTLAARAAFLREAGTSPLAERVRRACGASGEP